MLTSITPLGELGKRQRWGVTATAYVLGSVLAGSALGAVLGTLGALVLDPSRVALALAAAACGLAALADAAGLLPRGRRQVDEDWLTRYRGWVYGAGFGLQLGLGVVTVVTSAATYAVGVLALVSAGVLPGLGIGACFGLVRALPILAVRRARTPELLRAAAARLELLAAAARSATVGALALAALVLAGGAVLA